jgi:hypothetical protein
MGGKPAALGPPASILPRTGGGGESMPPESIPLRHIALYLGISVLKPYKPDFPSASMHHAAILLTR